MQTPESHDPFKKTMHIVGQKLLKEASKNDPPLENSQSKDADVPLYKLLESMNTGYQVLESVLPDEENARALKDMRTLSAAVLRAALFTIGRDNGEVREKKSLSPTLMGEPTRNALMREEGEMLEDGTWLVPDRTRLGVVWPIQQMINRLSSTKYSTALFDVIEQILAFGGDISLLSINEGISSTHLKQS